MNYSMAPPRDAVDQTVARPPVADGDPYSTPVPRHFASNSRVFFPISMAHVFFLHSPFLDDSVGPLLILFFWKVRRSCLHPYGTPTDHSSGGFQSFTVAGNGCGKEITSLIFSLGVGSRPFWERSGSIFDGKPGKTL